MLLLHFSDTFFVAAVFLAHSLLAHHSTTTCHQEVSVFIISLLHSAVQWKGRCEHGLDRLERSVRGFWIEQIHNRDPDEVQASKQEVCTAL